MDEINLKERSMKEKNAKKKQVTDPSLNDSGKKIDHFREYFCSMTDEAIKHSIINALKYWLGKDEYSATDYDWYMSCAYSIRNRVVERWSLTQNHYYYTDAKRVYYLSLEFLIGQLMGNNLYNLEVYDRYAQALKGLGFDIERLRDLEKDAGLGNGGLGRLAACFMDSMATMGLPAYGYGIRYEFGIFRQRIVDGWQVEEPDEWLKHGNPWEIVRPEYSQTVEFEGRIENYLDDQGMQRMRWVDTKKVTGLPYDTPVIGYGTDNVNTLRLWSARAHEEFDFQLFNHGDYIKAVEEKNIQENISKVLYPNDDLTQGKELRLKQQYFFVSCTVKDIIRRYKKAHPDFSNFTDKVAIQLNDTHPTLAIPELMRILVDIEKLPWEKAWDITVAVFGYTNHTLLPEALETWSVALFKKFLPRHLQILFEINHRFLKEVMIKYPGDMDKLTRMSIFAEGQDQRVRMAYLCMVGSHSTNGVSELHSRLIKENLAPDFYQMWPERFNNKTNGITPRRWLLKCNSALAGLLTSCIGDGWVTNLNELKKMIPQAKDKTFRRKFSGIKRQNKLNLAQYILENNQIEVDPDSIFDVQAKRLHEYKRQLMNILHVIHLYLKLKDDPSLDIHPRTFIYAAKAAPGYYTAKLIIKLINNVADIINSDLSIKGKLKVVFLADYRVSLAEVIIPAADVSEQISTAGLEASGTGNMKFALNGALTIGTLDGANVEIMEEVGEENIYIFGKRAEEIEAMKRNHSYNPRAVFEADQNLRRIFNLISSGFFSLGQNNLFEPLISALLNEDRYFILADFQDYCLTQEKIDRDYKNPDVWFRKAILNTLNMAKFSSDRTIADYAREIWHVKAVKFDMEKNGNCFKKKESEEELLAEEN
ncbi:MAG: glycogen/starch/alpha-glucan phosphorylase [Candidatus Wallbacteria bacterium]|nr:glycogen/starch/alpha-glucan phosphorylase [Candidatus Wallbacteria bacterium]